MRDLKIWSCQSIISVPVIVEFNVTQQTNKQKNPLQQQGQGILIFKILLSPSQCEVSLMHKYLGTCVGRGLRPTSQDTLSVPQTYLEVKHRLEAYYCQGLSQKFFSFTVLC